MEDTAQGRATSLENWGRVIPGGSIPLSSVYQLKNPSTKGFGADSPIVGWVVRLYLEGFKILGFMEGAAMWMATGLEYQSAVEML